MQLSYKEQLSDSRWLRKKGAILERDGYTCQRCGASSNLNVHHKVYNNNKMAWEYDDADLITLCQNCHCNEHRIIPVPHVGKFYAYEHSDFQNDMLCYHIDNLNKLVYLFGVDNGDFSSPWIEITTFDFFTEKYFYSNIFSKKELDYTEYSFINAFRNMQKTKRCNLDGWQKLYPDSAIIEFAIKKVSNLIDKLSILTTI